MYTPVGQNPRFAAIYRTLRILTVNKASLVQREGRQKIEKINENKNQAGRYALNAYLLLKFQKKNFVGKQRLLIFIDCVIIETL